MTGQGELCVELPPHPHPARRRRSRRAGASWPGRRRRSAGCCSSSASSGCRSRATATATAGSPSTSSPAPASPVTTGHAERRHHPRPRRVRRRPPRGAPPAAARALPDRARPPAPRGRPLLLADPGRRRRRRASAPARCSATSAADYAAGARAPLRAGPAAGLGRALRQRLRGDAPGRGLGGDLLPLPPHPRHAADRRRLPAAGAGARGGRRARPGRDLSSTPRDGRQPFEEILGEWLPLTYALNALNRSMGRGDLYPFVLPGPWSTSWSSCTTWSSAGSGRWPALSGVGCGSMGEIPETARQASARAVARPATRAGGGASGARPPRSPSSRPTGSAPRSRGSRGESDEAAGRDRRPHRRDRPRDHPRRREGLCLVHSDRRLGPADPGRPAGRGRRPATAPCPGSIGRKPIHLLKDEQKKKAVELDGPSHRHRRRRSRGGAEMLRIGDPVVIDAEPLALAGDRLASRSMDNRLGSYVALEVARRCHERGGHAASVAGGRRGPGGDRHQRRPHLRLPARSPRSRSSSTSPTPPTPPASRRRSPAATRSAPAR